MSKSIIRPVPTIEPKLLAGPKRDLFHYLLQSLGHSVGPTVRSELLPRQLESCLGGIRAAANHMKAAQADELAQQYQQIWEDYIKEAQVLAEDHLHVFFVACQIYVTRVVEAVRWFKLHVGADFGLPECYVDPLRLRALGAKVVGQITIAECCWFLGNYAKHNDEIELLHNDTLKGLQILGMLDTSGNLVDQPACVGVESVVGLPIKSPSDLEVALKVMEARLRAWSDWLEDEIIADLDEHDCGDRTRTRRENERWFAIWHPKNGGQGKAN